MNGLAFASYNSKTFLPTRSKNTHKTHQNKPPNMTNKPPNKSQTDTDSSVFKDSCLRCRWGMQAVRSFTIRTGTTGSSCIRQWCGIHDGIKHSIVAWGVQHVIVRRREVVVESKDLFMHTIQVMRNGVSAYSDVVPA